MNAYEEYKLRREKRRQMLPFVIGSAILGLVVGAVLSYGIFIGTMSVNARSVMEAMQEVETRFVGDYDEGIMTDYMLDGMIYALDDQWSYYLTAEEYNYVQESRTNSYTGIGVTIQSQVGNSIGLLDVTKDSPAAEAGILATEEIVSVNEVMVTKQNWHQCVEGIGGDEGTFVTLGIRSADGEVRTVKVERREIYTIPVEYEMLEGQIGLVHVLNFYSGSAYALIEAVEDLQGQGVQAIIFDMRDNPGGYVTELTEMLDFLLPEGVIFQSFDIDGKEEIYTSDADCVDLPFAVLVNAESYSAAELFAAQLNESVSAPVIGEKTSGKGYAQQLIPLENGSALGLSTSKYTTGQGRSLVGTGIVPNPLVKLSKEEYKALLRGELPHRDDGQLQAALEALKIS